MDTESPADYILRRIKDICPRGLSKAELQKTRLTETGVDSLEFMELIMEIETTYEIEIADSMISGDLTVGRFCELSAALAGEH